jgi:uncharacterized membrane protein YczE
LLKFFGASRHTGLPMLRRSLAKRSLLHQPLSILSQAGWLACGSLMIGTSVAMLVKADLGLPPYDVMTSALSRLLPITLGQAGWLLALAFFAVATVLRHPPSVWGIAYVVGNGLAIDGVVGLLNAPETLPARLAMLGASIVLMAVGVNLVLASGTTGGPFELLMAAGADRGISRVTSRYVLDGGILGLGIILGGDFGVGTLIHAAVFGGVLAIVGQAFADHRAGRSSRLTVDRPAQVSSNGDSASGESGAGPESSSGSSPDRVADAAPDARFDGTRSPTSSRS